MERLRSEQPTAREQLRQTAGSASGSKVWEP